MVQLSIVKDEGKKEVEKKKEIIRTHEDLIEKPAFYEKYDLINKLK